jgi:acetate kinase
MSTAGMELNESIDPTACPLISTKGSRVAVYVIPTNEELMIAQHTLQILQNIDREEDYIQAS